MSNSPVVFNLPERTIGEIEEYCNRKFIQKPEFIRDTMDEYCADKVKLANAVSRRILEDEGPEDYKIGRITNRISSNCCKTLRALAKRCYLTFDGLTRIIFDDKLRELAELRRLSNG